MERIVAAAALPAAPCIARLRAHEEHTMLDTLMLALAAGFFALAIGYTYACERL
ncbi:MULTISPECIES: hypothetical protein [unclassified Bradyrhizobium]|uniref:hypothetical protein n=1 Tax=unclassified Bradyrhizobium TaxID=2631580 RepID=UPI0028ED6351|nr:MULTISPECIES: hypothetical protein [unclassified Bradyrhizobium]